MAVLFWAIQRKVEVGEPKEAVGAEAQAGKKGELWEKWEGEVMKTTVAIQQAALFNMRRRRLLMRIQSVCDVVLADKPGWKLSDAHVYYSKSADIQGNILKLHFYQVNRRLWGTAHVRSDGTMRVEIGGDRRLAIIKGMKLPETIREVMEETIKAVEGWFPPEKSEA